MTRTGVEEGAIEGNLVVEEELMRCDAKLCAVVVVTAVARDHGNELDFDGLGGNEKGDGLAVVVTLIKGRALKERYDLEGKKFLEPWTLEKQIDGGNPILCRPTVDLEGTHHLLRVLNDGFRDCWSIG